MRRFSNIVAGALIIVAALISTGAWAQPVVGGYDLSKLSAATVARIVKAGVISEKEAAALLPPAAMAAGDPLVQGSEFVRLYDRLGEVLLQKKIVSPPDIEAARKTASESGGVKIGGVNPVVLAASYLDLLARKGILSLTDAQSLLDSSKVPR